ncbi:hypothetical protein STEG23_032147, partial [Scotinomys teguina]
MEHLHSYKDSFYYHLEGYEEDSSPHRDREAAANVGGSVYEGALSLDDSENQQGNVNQGGHMSPYNSLGPEGDHSNQVPMEEDPEEPDILLPEVPRRQPRRHQIQFQFTQWQLQEMETISQETQYPDVPTRKQLARWMGITEAKVQVPDPFDNRPLDNFPQVLPMSVLPLKWTPPTVDGVTPEEVILEGIGEQAEEAKRSNISAQTLPQFLPLVPTLTPLNDRWKSVNRKSQFHTTDDHRMRILSLLRHKMPSTGSVHGASAPMKRLITLDVTARYWYSLQDHCIRTCKRKKHKDRDLSTVAHWIIGKPGEGPQAEPGELTPGERGAGELFLPLTCYSTQDSRPCTSPAEYMKAADPVGRGA